MRRIIMTTALALTLAGTAHAQISVGSDTAAGVKVGNGASTVRVDGNSTVRTLGDGTTAITRPANDAVDNTRLGTEVNTRAKVNNSVDERARVNTRANVGTNPRRVYDPANGITRLVTGTTSGVMGSVTDTIKGPLDSGASVNSATSGSVNN